MVGAPTASIPVGDDEIVSRIRGGETDLFETVMRRYNQMLFRVVRSMLCNDLEAEEVLQETYVKAFEHLGQFAGTAKFSTWLTKIAVNEALSCLRRRRRYETLDEPESSHRKVLSPASPRPGPEEEAAQEQITRMLEATVDGLPEIYRCVFVMRAINGMSTAETAHCLDLTEENVKVRMHRARTMLRHQFTKRFGAAAPSAFRFLGYRCDRLVHAVMYRLQKQNAV